MHTIAKTLCTNTLLVSLSYYKSIKLLSNTTVIMLRPGPVKSQVIGSPAEAYTTLTRLLMTGSTYMCNKAKIYASL